MTAVKVPAAPRALSATGKRLWAAVLGEYELGPHELSILTEACHTADAMAELQREISKLGVMERTGFEVAKVRAALREIRQQRLVYLKLLGQLNLPVGDEDAKAAKHTRHRPRIRSNAGLSAVVDIGGA